MVNLSKQMKRRVSNNAKMQRVNKFEGSTEVMISTGSTLLDLAISGGRVKGGGIPGGIMCVAYGPSGSGKTVLACEVAGDIQRKGGTISYQDSEARLDKDFSKMFDLKYDEINYSRPNTIPDAFKPLYKWKPNTPNKINGYIVDSLAALSTSMEMDNEDGDKMGMRRAKEFSEHLRKGARKITDNNYLLFCTNQIRQKIDAQKFERKDINPGGKAIEFYASLILRFNNAAKIIEEKTISGKKVKRTIGIKVTIEIVKSSIWKPFHSAPVIIYFNYGIDDIQANLQYVKDYTSNKIYTVKNKDIGNSMEKAVAFVEKNNFEKKLKKQVISLWEEIESKFEVSRKSKVR